MCILCSVFSPFFAVKINFIDLFCCHDSILELRLVPDGCWWVGDGESESTSWVCRLIVFSLTTWLGPITGCSQSPTVLHQNQSVSSTVSEPSTADWQLAGLELLAPSLSVARCCSNLWCKHRSVCVSGSVQCWSITVSKEEPAELFPGQDRGIRSKGLSQCS